MMMLLRIRAIEKSGSEKNDSSGAGIVSDKGHSKEASCS
jgi:hypothetical protein